VLRLLLDGFLPACAMDAVPEGERRSGLRELGLPFASDPAVTRHLAAFLRAAADRGAVRPGVLLLNGGFFTPEEARARLVEVVSGWFPGPGGGAWAPRVLVNRSPATAVAEGAAYSGLVRRGFGLRIGAAAPAPISWPWAAHRMATTVAPSASFPAALRKAPATGSRDGSSLSGRTVFCPSRCCRASRAARRWAMSRPSTPPRCTGTGRS
jgi:hypothetical protein